MPRQSPMSLTGRVSPTRGRFKFKFTTNLDDMARKFAYLPRSAEKGKEAAVRRLFNLWSDILSLVNKPGMKPSYPIHWVNRRQQMAFLRSRGFGKGIPSQRTGEHIDGWKILPIQDGSVLQNRVPGSIFIWGDIHGQRQSPIHARRWPLFRDAAASVLARWSEGGWSRARSAFLRAFRQDFKDK